ncbi:MAG: ATP-dependent zinc protease [Gammaproteobacteria bacterium]|nr:ATP-dependent zinc protease [Gammaproteobacteria bacterium]
MFTLSFYGYASSDNPGKVIAGWVEKISLKDQSYVLKAKLDSGAETSSIHAEDIELFKHEGKRWVRFKLLLEDTDGKAMTLALEKKRARRVKIKQHNGVHDSRPVVELDICFDGRPYAVEFTLADRSEFIYPVLLGRRFLAGVAVVDPEATFLTQARCQ